MEAINEIHKDANEEMVRLTSAIDREVRPLQRAYFSCCHACSDDTRKAEEVGTCVESCVVPVSTVQEALSEAQHAFKSRMSRCHQMAGEGIPSSDRSSSVSEETMGLYVGKLKPCVQEEVKKLPALLKPIHSLIPQAMGSYDKLPGAGAGGLGGARKSWF